MKKQQNTKRERGETRNSPDLSKKYLLGFSEARLVEHIILSVLM